MLPTTKYGLMGAVAGLIIGTVAVGMYSSFSNKSSEPVITTTDIYGGSKTKHNRNHKNKSRKNK